MSFWNKLSCYDLLATERRSHVGQLPILIASLQFAPARQTDGGQSGNLGQSKAGDPRARYAVWQDGDVELKAYEYPVAKTVEKILALPLADEVKRDLVHVLRTGMAP